KRPNGYFLREYFHQFRVRPTASKVQLASPATGAITFPARIGIDGEIPWSLPATTRHQSCLDCLSALSASFQSLHLLPTRREQATTHVCRAGIPEPDAGHNGYAAQYAES